MKNRVWSWTFSAPGYSSAILAGTTIGAFYHAYTPAPMRYVPAHPFDIDDDGYMYQLSDQQWIAEGMRNGFLAGIIVNTIWPGLIAVGVPGAAIYYAARYLQKQAHQGHKMNKNMSD